MADNFDMTCFYRETENLEKIHYANKKILNRAKIIWSSFATFFQIKETAAEAKFLLYNFFATVRNQKGLKEQTLGHTSKNKHVFFMWPCLMF